ncbi:MAG: hypothetical protein ABC596_06960 [Candidatus Methanosuratincola petrocarbonis]
MKVRCKLAGMELKDVDGNPMACKACAGILVKKGKQLRHGQPVRAMYPFPRKGMEYPPDIEKKLKELIGAETFSCPATVVAFDEQGNLTEEVKNVVEEASS